MNPSLPSASSHRLVADAEHAFVTRFGQAPSHLALAPGRVTLLGEHVDYTGGVVLPIAIDRWTAAAVGPSSTHESRVRAEDLDREFGFDISRSLSPVRDQSKRFANHVLGVLEGLRDLGRPETQLELLITGSIPQGAGLSSSASLEVAVLRACEEFFDVLQGNRDAARLAQRAEHAFVGTPCGIMDMLVSAAAVEDHALLIDCSTLETTPIPLPDGETMGILLVDTGIRHDLANGAYGERRASCERVEAACGGSLGTLTHVQLEAAKLDPVDRHHGEHVISENERVREAVQALQSGDLKRFGALLFEGHESLRTLFEVSTPELDLLVDTAATLEEHGVFGARMTGGGFGGSVVVVHKPTARDGIVAALTEAFDGAFGRRPNAFQVRAVGGARRLY